MPKFLFSINGKRPAPISPENRKKYIEDGAKAFDKRIQERPKLERPKKCQT